MFFAGLLRQADHTADTQFNGWVKDILQDRLDFYNASPEAVSGYVAIDSVAVKICALFTDHAADQGAMFKLFEPWKHHYTLTHLGRITLSPSAAAEHADLIAKATATVIAAHRGPLGIQFASEEEYQQVLSEVQPLLAEHLGQAAWDAMDDSERLTIEFFVHAGCCMHKELNMVNGAHNAMLAVWDELGATPPIALLSKDAKAAREALGLSQQPIAAKEKSGRGTRLTRGAIRLLQLFGLEFKNSDSKKGYQERFLIWSLIEHELRLTIPDISNTRFGCYTEGAAFVLERRSLLLLFLEHVRDTKTAGPGFTNLENNIYLGLQDGPTLTELSALAFIGQCLSNPYLCQIRGLDINHLLLGPLHARLAAWIEKIIANIKLVTGTFSDSSHLEGAFDGIPFRRPEIFICIQKLVSDGLVSDLES